MGKFKIGDARPEKAGRKAGTPNKRSELLHDRAMELKADPFHFLASVMLGNAKEIATKRKFEDDDTIAPDKDGMVLIMPTIKFEDRLQAAKELMPYLYGKRKPVDSDGNDNDSLSTFLEKLSESK